uniref:Uncharacterized protein n=1 Tax=Brassica oleracea var. oleracea TaxID=109376 RepID=A0A0D3E6F0_BRAOL
MYSKLFSIDNEFFSIFFGKNPRVYISIFQVTYPLIHLSINVKNTSISLAYALPSCSVSLCSTPPPYSRKPLPSPLLSSL